jgi:hypothetical protein
MTAGIFQKNWWAQPTLRLLLFTAEIAENAEKKMVLNELVEKVFKDL